MLAANFVLMKVMFRKVTFRMYVPDSLVAQIMGETPFPHAHVTRSTTTSLVFLPIGTQSSPLCTSESVIWMSLPPTLNESVFKGQPSACVCILVKRARCAWTWKLKFGELRSVKFSKKMS